MKSHCLTSCAMVMGLAVGAGAALAAPPMAIKPAHTIVNPAHAMTDVIAVKFRDGQMIRVRQGALSDLGTGALDGAQQVLAGLAGARWERMHRVSEDELDRLHGRARATLDRHVADPNLVFLLFLPPGIGASQAIDALNTLDTVHLAMPVPRAFPAPNGPPNLEADQGYLNAATDGVDAECAWSLTGGTGAGIQVADLEYSWNFNHLDLAASLLGPVGTDPFADNNHGTAVLGEIGGQPNGFGVTGICYDATIYGTAVNVGGVQNIAAAITTALGTLGTGDAILIEQQTGGPNFLNDGTQFGLVPVEWFEPTYDAIVMAIGNGVMVIEAAGNGSQNLDAPEYSVGNGGHWPFLLANDSGAIIVGAGAPPGHPSGDRSRLGFSCYGATVDLQGWGAWVVTTGYGDAYPGGIPDPALVNEWFTDSFSGTSSASPIVTGSCVLLQNIYFNLTGVYLTPAEVRIYLRSTGSPQLSGDNPASQQIGPRPDISAAISAALPALDPNNNGVPDVCEPDCNGNGVPDITDITNGTSQDCNNNDVPDECDIMFGGSMDCQPNGIPDECELANGTAQDCNNNGVLDVCDIATGTSEDCQPNGIPDECDINPGDPDGNGQVSPDCNLNAIPDECEDDCNNNGVPDDCDIDPNDPDGNGMVSEDCQPNGIPDECDIDPNDPDGNGLVSEDCNLNTIPDECEVVPETNPALTVGMDDCVDAELIGPGIVYIDTTAGTTPDGFGFCGTAFSVFDEWYRYKPAWNGLTFIMVNGPPLQPVMSVFEGCPGDARQFITCNRINPNGVTFFATKGVDYWIRVAGNDFNVGFYRMRLVGPNVLLNDNDANANMIPDVCECLADVNGDNVVDMLDFGLVMAAYGPCPGCVEDVDGSGVVDDWDLQEVLINLGLCPFP